MNRLDRDTAGFLYFAKNVYNYAHYKKRQAQGRVHKHYLAVVRGEIGYILHKKHQKQRKRKENPYVDIEDDRIVLSYPLMHHAQLDDRMVAIKNRNDMAR